MTFSTRLNRTLLTSALFAVSVFANGYETLTAQNSLVTQQNVLTSQFYAAEMGEQNVQNGVSVKNGVINQFNVLSSVDYVSSLPATEQQLVANSSRQTGAIITRENVLTSR